MAHETKDLILAIGAIVSMLAAVGVPWLMYVSMKTAFAETWGKMQQLVAGHEQQLNALKETVDEHTKSIGYLQGRTNGESLRVPHGS